MSKTPTRIRTQNQTSKDHKTKSKPSAEKIGKTVAILGLVVAIITLWVNYLQYKSSMPNAKPITIETAIPSSNSADVPIIPDPTAISVSIQDEIKRDDFSSENTGWNNYSKSDVATGYENGRYFIQVAKKLLFLSVWTKAGMIDNGILQVDIYGPFESTGYAQGLGFGWHSGWEDNNYAFTIDGNGTCLFWEYSIDAWFTKVQGKTESFDINRGYHTLKVEIRGSEAIGYVDGTFCAMYKMPNYKQGLVGVVASPSATIGSGKFYFDEYRIYRIP